VSDAEGVYKIAQAYSVLDDPAAALRVLGRSIETGFFCFPYMARDPLFKGIRGTAPFDNLLEQARRRHEAFKGAFF
jgi:hypothetical protein